MQPTHDVISIVMLNITEHYCEHYNLCNKHTQHLDSYQAIAANCKCSHTNKCISGTRKQNNIYYTIITQYLYQHQL